MPIITRPYLAEWNGAQNATAPGTLFLCQPGDVAIIVAASGSDGGSQGTLTISDATQLVQSREATQSESWAVWYKQFTTGGSYSPTVSYSYTPNANGFSAMWLFKNMPPSWAPISGEWSAAFTVGSPGDSGVATPAISGEHGFGLIAISAGASFYTITNPSTTDDTNASSAVVKAAHLYDMGLSSFKARATWIGFSFGIMFCFSVRPMYANGGVSLAPVMSFR